MTTTNENAAGSIRAAERMFDLSIRPLVDGGFELEQSAGSLDEPAVIQMHPVQVRLLAERAGLLAVRDPTLVDRLSARHVGRLRALREWLGDIYRFYIDEIVDHCGSGVEISLHLRAIESLADDLLADVETEGGDGNEKSASIPVTPPSSKRGRPATGDALSNAERQVRHREKKAEAPKQSPLNLPAIANTAAAGRLRMPSDQFNPAPVDLMEFTA